MRWATVLGGRYEGGGGPAGAVLLSPWVDLERTGETIDGNAAFDYLHRRALDLSAEHYLGGGDPRHPHVSAVHADLAGLPPLLIQTGGAEMFLSENRRLAERARSAGVRVVHEIEEGMVHVWHALASFTPEPLAAIERIGGFVRMIAGTDAAASRSAEQGAAAPACEGAPEAAAVRG